MSTSKPSIICPRCDQVDAVFKVSVLYEQGFSKAQYQQFVLPPRGTNWAPLLVTRDSVSQTALSKKLAPPPKPGESTSSNWPFLILGLLFFGLPVALFGPQTGPAIGAVASFVTAFFLYFRRNQQKPRWQHAIWMWGQLYYCLRDDIVFIPGTSVSTPANQMMSILYE
jgi:hypothetical protein